jgi:hypothetical protein
MKSLFLALGLFIAACWCVAFVADWLIGKVERDGHDGL